MKLSRVDHERVRGAIIGAHLIGSGGRHYDAARASEILALLDDKPETIETRLRRALCAALAFRARQHLHHLRAGRQGARSFLEPEPGTYYSTRPIADRQELASRQLRDAPKHARELRAFLRLRRRVRSLRAES